MIERSLNTCVSVHNKKNCHKQNSDSAAASVCALDGPALNPGAAGLFWSYINRTISFDDPDTRIKRLGELSVKQPGSSGLQTELPPPADDELSARLLGSLTISSCRASLLLNLLLALEDLDRFTPISFQVACAGTKQMGISKAADWLTVYPAGSPQQLWLCRALTHVVDWQRLRETGPWSQDSRAQFLVAALELAEHSAPAKLTASGLQSCQQAFRQLLVKWRPLLPGSFLPHLIILVEGPTEALLLPHLAQCLSISFAALGIHILPAGGANQVVRRFLELRDLTLLPIVCLLDRDAQSQACLLSDSLRDKDRLHVLGAGEIEDVFACELLVELINEHLSSHGLPQQITLGDLSSGSRRTAVLNRVWREAGLGTFDKVGFAHTIVETVCQPSQVPSEIRGFLQAIKQLVAGAAPPEGSQPNMT